MLWALVILSGLISQLERVTYLPNSVWTPERLVVCLSAYFSIQAFCGSLGSEIVCLSGVAARRLSACLQGFNLVCLSVLLAGCLSLFLSSKIYVCLSSCLIPHPVCLRELWSGPDCRSSHDRTIWIRGGVTCTAGLLSVHQDGTGRIKWGKAIPWSVVGTEPVYQYSQSSS